MGDCARLKEYRKAQNYSLPNRRESTEKSRVGMRDRRSRGDGCATSRRFSRWNEEQGPHPETSVSDRGLGTGGLVHARKGGVSTFSIARLWELSRFSVLNKKSVSEIPNSEKKIVSSSTRRLGAEQIPLDSSVWKTQIPTRGFLRYYALTPKQG